MIRAKLVEAAYQRGKELTLNNEFYLRWLEEFFDREYKEDIGSGDLTSEALLTRDRQGRAILKLKQTGVVGGVEEASWFFKKHGLEVKVHVRDGERVQKGEAILEALGGQRDLLATERIGLNVLQRMSGIATETRSLVELIKDHKTRIAATRKTLLRYLDKKAVFLGGGLTHRFGLWDSILIKDNHLEALKNKGIRSYVEKAIDMASASIDKAGFLEIETTNLDETLKAARKLKQLKPKKPCAIMLDNAPPSEIKRIIEKLKEEELYDSVLLEASGNISPKNITKYAETEVDVISMGYLTHSARAFDMSLEMT